MEILQIQMMSPKTNRKARFGTKNKFPNDIVLNTTGALIIVDSVTAATTDKSCIGSKKECESRRDPARASTHWYRAGSECYKL